MPISRQKRPFADVDESDDSDDESASTRIDKRLKEEIMQEMNDDDEEADGKDEKKYDVLNDDDIEGKISVDCTGNVALWPRFPESSI